ncbi:DUF5985 family protein [Lacipirellula sp.]|uniref:DUF5985 family protein n=1 Tax=Lacipirellula sp. TaxID=2691419 RepID=UPI003D144ECF
MAMEHFIMGAIAMASLVVAAFFLRFWRDTHDRLFAMFAVAFVLLGLTRLGLAMSGDASEGNTSWYWVRLAAFILILVAIADKNKR